jgi:ribosome-associated protein
MAKKSKNNKDQANTEALLDAIIAGVREKKGKMIRKFDLTGLKHASTDYFIICHGDSQRQSVAIADSVEDEVRKMIGEKPWHVEGTQNAQWILMDYVNVVVHVFFKEAREFYDIESLWADAAISEIDEEEIILKPAIKKKVKTSVKKAEPVSKKTSAIKKAVVKPVKAIAKSKKVAAKPKKK